jgi:hypothetical protein
VIFQIVQISKFASTSVVPSIQQWSAFCGDFSVIDCKLGRDGADKVECDGA